MNMQLPRKCAVAVLAALALGYSGCGLSQAAEIDAGKKAQPKEIEVDFCRAMAVALPIPKAPLKPEPLKVNGTLKGWIFKFDGDRPIATPAYYQGMIFVGGGYGSHEFYALDANTGKLAWQVKTGDDGPTAAVVENGYVAFNTESCTVYVLEARTGKTVWQEWLGDPLMSQPAIASGRLYMVYPGGQRGHGRPGHRLLCADLKTGKHLWEQGITTDAISAPVIDGNKVYVTCMDGTSFCMDAVSGQVYWKKANGGTSAPTIAAGKVLITEKGKQNNRDSEGVRRLDTINGAPADSLLLAEAPAPYFKLGKSVSLSPASQKSLDSSVGFGGGAPSGAGMQYAADNLGVGTVAGGWAFQGARAAYHNGQIVNAQGSAFNCLNAKDGKIAWRARAKGTGVTQDAQMFSPPALGQQNIYVCSTDGHVVSLSQKDGSVKFMYDLKQPMGFQPALANGNMYIGTANGMLVCLNTGDKDADGWAAWGGNAQHNKN